MGGKMSEEKIISFVSCLECKNFIEYGYTFEGEDVTDCELGRYKEHSLGERNGHMTKCEYWEAKECH